jgi:large subunit ribosomal protein L17
MRHGKKINHLSRTASHRGALMSNMATSLIMHKRINTTVAKAKALRKYVEPLLTKAKTDTTHSRRIVFSYLQDKYAVTELFKDVAEKIADRPGGYTRIIRTGNRPGDAADMCMMELVDYNTVYTTDKAPAKKAKTTRRRGGKKAKSTTTEAAAEVTESAVVAEEAKPKKTTRKKKADKGDDTSKLAEE